MTTTATVTSSPITATVSGASVSAAVTSSSTSASASGGVGPAGAAGQQGAAGVAGVAGPAGVAGEKGDRGDVGPQGLPGVAGSVGPAGSAGADGVAGVAGPKGDPGERGQAGPAGEAGAQGIQGIPGVAGATGAKGDRGDVGPQGPAGVAGATGPQGPQASLVYSSITDFPATGSSTALYLDESTSRLYQWESPVYVEVGTSGGGIATTSASDLTSGTLADARLSSTVTTALTNARTPTSHASSHASGGSDALTLAASQIASGTLADALLSTNVPLIPGVLGLWSSQSSFIETTFRAESLAGSLSPASGSVFLTFFTPLVSITISQILMSSGIVASSGLTLARMGLYTVTESAANLVARTASDTTLFGSISTSYARSLATDGGFPSTYNLVAGTRYAVGVIQVGTTPAQLVGKFSQVGVTTLAPRVTAIAFAQSDLANISSYSANAAIVYARLS